MIRLKSEVRSPKAEDRRPKAEVRRLRTSGALRFDELHDGGSPTSGGFRRGGIGEHVWRGLEDAVDNPFQSPSSLPVDDTNLGKPGFMALREIVFHKAFYLPRLKGMEIQGVGKGKFA